MNLKNIAKSALQSMLMFAAKLLLFLAIICSWFSKITLNGY